MFNRPGRSNDFRELRSRLTLIATELDTGEAALFGRPGWDHVPISRAIQASAALPGIPPVADTLPGFSIETWWGLVAPAGTPKATLDKLNQAFVAALEAPETKTRYNTLLAEPTPTTAAQFDQFMASERAKYQSLVKASGATVD